LQWTGLPRTLENLESEEKSGEKILALESQGKSGNISLSPGFFIFQAFSLCRERAAAEKKLA